MAKNIARLDRLKRLALAGSFLTDAGIKHLAGLTNLESLDLRRTKATAAGIAEQQTALPKCKIEWDGGRNRSQENPDKANSEDSRPEESKRE